MIPYADDRPLTGEWTDIFRRDRAIHLALVLSIVAGTFQGWLKDRFGDTESLHLPARHLEDPETQHDE